MTREGPGQTDPPAGPEAMADLRHDLRTPVNHIIGYSELLIEEAEDLGRPDLLGGFRDLLDLGRDLSALIDAAVPRAGAGVDRDRLRDGSSDLVGRIAAGCDKLRGEVGGAALAALLDDLGRVRAAADRLAALVARRLGGPGPGPGPGP